MYVLNRKRQISLIQEMTQLRKDRDRWEVYYHHPSTNAMWKSYFPQANGSHRGPKVLRTEPVPEQLEDRLADSLQDRNPENAMGLAIELSVYPDQWASVMDIVEANYRAYDRKQLSMFLKHLGVESHQELFSQLEKEAHHFNIGTDELNNLSRRSRIIRFRRFFLL